MKPYYQDNNITLYNDDCLNVIKYLIDIGKKVNHCIADPPYGSTLFNWDKIIDPEKLKQMLSEILMTQGNCLLFGSEPFFAKTLVYFIKGDNFTFSHELIWQKNKSANIFSLKSCPRKTHEKIMVLRNTRISEEVYTYQNLIYKNIKFKNTKLLAKTLGTSRNMISHYFTHFNQMLKISENIYDNLIKFYNIDKLNFFLTYEKYVEKFYSQKLVYNPQVVGRPYSRLENGNFFKKEKDTIFNSVKSFGTTNKLYLNHEIVGENVVKIYYQGKNPLSILTFNLDKGFHPTQKPVSLLEYLVKTYTNKNDVILDFSSGSGSLAIACIRNNRKVILIEKSRKYCDQFLEWLKKEYDN